MVVQVVQRVTAAPTTQQLAIAHNNVVDFLTGSKSPTLFKVLNVGATTNAVDTGDGWLAGGLSLGTYSNPGVGQLTMSGQLISSLATGTAPFTVASTTLVPNLNASKLNSAAASATPTASTIPIADGSGKLDIGWIPAAVGSGTYLPLAGGTLTGDLLFSTDNSHDIGASAATRPRAVYVGSRLGVGAASATLALVVSGSVATDFVASFTQTNTTAGTSGLGVLVSATDAASAILTLISNGVVRAKVWADGGVTIGAVANPGAGLLNVANGVQKNGLAYNFPDYVFEHFYTGDIEKFAANPGAADYPGLLSLEAVEAFAREHWHLPRVGTQRDIFDRADAALEHIESLYLHLFAMNRRLLALEGTAPVRAA